MKKINKLKQKFSFPGESRAHQALTTASESINKWNKQIGN